MNACIAVVPVEGKGCKAFPYRFFHRRVDIVVFVGLDEVVGNDYCRVRNHFAAFQLGCAEQTSQSALTGFTGVVVRSDFHLIERHKALLVSPVFSPLGHQLAHPLHEGLVKTDIGASLVPDEALCGVALHGMLHAVVHHIGLAPLAGSHGLRGKILVTIGLKSSLGKPALHPGASAREGKYAYRHVQHFL